MCHLQPERSVADCKNSLKCQVRMKLDCLRDGTHISKYDEHMS